MIDVSLAMGALSLLPGVRKPIIVAAGTSCRHQIADGTERRATVHVVEVLARALHTAAGR